MTFSAQVYRALLAFKDGDVTDIDASPTHNFSEANWGINGARRKWIQRVRHLINKLDQEMWNDIIEAAEEVRDQSYRKRKRTRRIKAEPDADEVEEELSGSDDESAFKRRRK